MLFLGDGQLASRVEAVGQGPRYDAAVAMILDFIRAPRKRPLCAAHGDRSEE